MIEHPVKLPHFVFREPDDAGDVRLLRHVREHGWHVVGIADDDEGPGFAFTVGVYLRTLQPEILIMGVPVEPSLRILNAIAGYLMEGERIVPGVKYSDFVDDRKVLFRPVHRTWYYDYMGCADWFYRPWGESFPVLQCVWPDRQGRFPDEDGFDPRLAGRQIDLSLPQA